MVFNIYLYVESLFELIKVLANNTRSLFCLLSSLKRFSAIRCVCLCTQNIYIHFHAFLSSLLVMYTRDTRDSTISAGTEISQGREDKPRHCCIFSVSPHALTLFYYCYVSNVVNLAIKFPGK